MTRRTMLLANAAALGLLGCESSRPPGPKPGGPPLDFHFRKSKVPGQGMVVGVRNASTDEPLDEIVILVRSPGEASPRSHRIEGTLRPEDTITVGWVELDGWKLRPGDEVSVRCRQYADASSATVPAI